MAVRALLVAVFVVLLAALAGCGSGGSSTVAEGAHAAEVARQAAEPGQAAEATAPRGASPNLRHLYRSFPPPSTSSMAPGLAKAVAAGERACRDKTPTAVKEEFYPAAEESLEPQQAQMIGRIADFEKQAKTDRSFVAGQLAADTYAATLDEATAVAGYQGCVYSLAVRLERELSP